MLQADRELVVCVHVSDVRQALEAFIMADTAAPRYTPAEPHLDFSETCACSAYLGTVCVMHMEEQDKARAAAPAHVRDLRAQLSAQAGEIAELRAALQPFADLSTPEGIGRATPSMIRAARAALAAGAEGK